MTWVATVPTVGAAETERAPVAPVAPEARAVPAGLALMEAAAPAARAVAAGLALIEAPAARAVAAGLALIEAPAARAVAAGLATGAARGRSRRGSRWWRPGRQRIVRRRQPPASDPLGALEPRTEDLRQNRLGLVEGGIG